MIMMNVFLRTFKITMVLLLIFALIFVVLKSIGFIDWSWWITLTPLWISFGIIIGITLYVVYMLSRYK
jgi:hypothetical protein